MANIILIALVIAFGWVTKETIIEAIEENKVLDEEYKNFIKSVDK